MKYNIEKINEIGKLLAEIVEEALVGERKEDVRIADIEMGVPSVSIIVRQLLPII
jgi:hypothetical protein